jgi:hypothetical protein
MKARRLLALLVTVLLLPVPLSPVASAQELSNPDPAEVVIESRLPPQ